MINITLYILLWQKIWIIKVVGMLKELSHLGYREYQEVSPLEIS